MKIWNLSLWWARCFSFESIIHLEYYFWKEIGSIKFCNVTTVLFVLSKDVFSKYEFGCFLNINFNLKKAEVSWKFLAQKCLAAISFQKNILMMRLKTLYLQTVLRIVEKRKTVRIWIQQTTDKRRLLDSAPIESEIMNMLDIRAVQMAMRGPSIAGYFDFSLLNREGLNWALI